MLDRIINILDTEGVSGKILQEIIDYHTPRATEMYGMHQRYLAKGLPIQKRKFEDDSKLNNIVSNDYRGEIVDGSTGYVFGRPISYQIDEADYGEKQAIKLNEFLDRWEMSNNLPDLDNETGKIASICGYAARLLYVDTNGSERAININPWEVVFLGDNYAMRYYNHTVKVKGIYVDRQRVEWYDTNNISYYIKTDKGFVLDPSEDKPTQKHMFKYVPLIKFTNSDDELGDFEKVEPLIDAYDRLVSDSQNELEEFRQAYMKFIGAKISEDTMKKARKSGGFGLPEGADVGFITKNVNDVFLENQKKTLNDNIYKFSSTVDMSDESFSGGGQSGESRKWKLLALENKAINKERKFTRALQDQFRVLTSAWETKGIKIDYLDIVYTFTRNTPIDMQYYATIIKDLKGLISDQTLFSNIPFIEDAQQEILKLEQEMGDYLSMPQYLGEVDEYEQEATEETTD